MSLEQAAIEHPRARRAPAAVVLFPTLLALACGGDRPASAGAAADEPAAGGTALVCSQAAPESLNPFVSPDQGARDLAALLFAPLVRYDAEAAEGVAPYLARSWGWSEDGRGLTLHLRSDVSWHDGEPLTSADVVWTVRRAVDPAYGYGAGGGLAALEDARAPDDSTVVLRFRHRPPGDLEPFVALPVLPAHLLEGIDDPEAFRRADFHREPVGSGPFRFAERRTDGTLVFERFDGFPAELGRPWLDRIAFRAVPEPGTLVAELETGGVDVCVGGASLAANTARSRRIHTASVGPEGVQTVILNTARPPLDDVRVRRAISAAIDRGSVAAVVSPLAEPAGSALPPNSPHHEPSLVVAESRPELAASLLEEAGVSEVRLTLMAPPQLEPALTAVQAQLARVGIRLDLRFMEFASLIPAIMNPQTRPDAMALGFYDDRLLAPDYYDTFHSQGERNIAGYASPEVDRILERLREEGDDAERRALYRELQERLAEDVPAVFTIYVPRTLAVGERLRGVEPSAEGPFGSAASWWLAGGRR